MGKKKSQQVANGIYYYQVTCFYVLDVFRGRAYVKVGGSWYQPMLGAIKVHMPNGYNIPLCWRLALWPLLLSVPTLIPSALILFDTLIILRYNVTMHYCCYSNILEATI